MITIYGKEAVLLEKGEKYTLSVVEINEQIIFIKDKDIQEAIQ